MWLTPAAWPPAKPPNLIHNWSGAALRLSPLGGRGRRWLLTGAPGFLCLIPPEISSNFDEVEQSDARLSEHVQVSASTTPVSAFIWQSTR